MRRHDMSRRRSGARVVADPVAGRTTAIAPEARRGATVDQEPVPTGAPVGSVAGAGGGEDVVEEPGVAAFDGLFVGVFFVVSGVVSRCLTWTMMRFLPDP